MKHSSDTALNVVNCCILWSFMNKPWGDGQICHQKAMLCWSMLVSPSMTPPAPTKLTLYTYERRGRLEARYHVIMMPSHLRGEIYKLKQNASPFWWQSNIGCMLVAYPTCACMFWPGLFCAIAGFILKRKHLLDRKITILSKREGRGGTVGAGSRCHPRYTTTLSISSYFGRWLQEFWPIPRCGIIAYSPLNRVLNYDYAFFTIAFRSEFPQISLDIFPNRKSRIPLNCTPLSYIAP
jgi:hypothetical protein